MISSSSSAHQQQQQQQEKEREKGEEAVPAPVSVWWGSSSSSSSSSAGATDTVSSSPLSSPCHRYAETMKLLASPVPGGNIFVSPLTGNFLRVTLVSCCLPTYVYIAVYLHYTDYSLVG
jgi:hypothetical protein